MHAAEWPYCSIMQSGPTGMAPANVAVILAGHRDSIPDVPAAPNNGGQHDLALPQSVLGVSCRGTLPPRQCWWRAQSCARRAAVAQTHGEGLQRAPCCAGAAHCSAPLLCRTAVWGCLRKGSEVPPTVSAMLVASTILRTPGGGRTKTRRWSAGGTMLCRGSTL